MVYTDLCSFYFSVFDEHAVDMTLKEFVKLLRGERWKVQVEEYQRLKASGRETEAKKLKRKLAALVIAGRCDGSHAETNLKQWSGDAMLDVDKCNGRVSEFLQVLKDTPWVKAAWRSVSYDGLKLVVRVEAESVDEYRLAYALVAWQYCSKEYVKLLTDNGIRISMTEKGDPYENAVAERVNGILKSEWIDEECFESFQAAKERIDQIVILYNSLRPHASCDWLTPLEAELRTGKLKHHWGRKTVVRKAYVNLYQDNIF